MALRLYAVSRLVCTCVGKFVTGAVTETIVFFLDYGLVGPSFYGGFRDLASVMCCL